MKVTIRKVSYKDLLAIMVTHSPKGLFYAWDEGPQGANFIAVDNTQKRMRVRTDFYHDQESSITEWLLQSAGITAFEVLGEHTNEDGETWNMPIGKKDLWRNLNPDIDIENHQHELKNHKKPKFPEDGYDRPTIKDGETQPKSKSLITWENTLIFFIKALIIGVVIMMLGFYIQIIIETIWKP